MIAMFNIKSWWNWLQWLSWIEFPWMLFLKCRTWLDFSETGIPIVCYDFRWIILIVSTSSDCFICWLVTLNWQWNSNDLCETLMQYHFMKFHASRSSSDDDMSCANFQIFLTSCNCIHFWNLMILTAWNSMQYTWSQTKAKN